MNRRFWNSSGVFRWRTGERRHRVGICLKNIFCIIRIIFCRLLCYTANAVYFKRNTGNKSKRVFLGMFFCLFHWEVLATRLNSNLNFSKCTTVLYLMHSNISIPTVRFGFCFQSISRTYDKSCTFLTEIHTKIHQVRVQYSESIKSTGWKFPIFIRYPAISSGVIVTTANKREYWNYS